MKIYLRFCFIIFALIFSIENAAVAANTYTWNGSASSTWNTATNWLFNGATQTALGSYPGQLVNTDIVSFVNTSAVSVSVAALPQGSIATLTLANNSPVTLTLASGMTLGITTTVTLGTSSTLSLLGPGDVVGTSAISLNTGAKLTSNATASLTAASITLSGNNTLTLVGQLTLSGLLQASSPGSVMSSTIETDAAGNTIGLFQAHSSSNVTWNGSGTTTCAGLAEIYTQSSSANTFTVGAGNTITFSANLSIDASNPYSALFVNKGTISVGGTVSTSDPGSVITAITNSSGGSMTFSGAVGLANHIVFNNNSGASVTFTGASSQLNVSGSPSAYLSAGSTSFTSSTVALSGNPCNIKFTGATNATSTLFNVSGSNDKILNDVGGNLTLIACTIKMTSNPDTLINNGNYIATSTPVTMSGQNGIFSNSSTGTIQMSVCPFTLSGGTCQFNNSGSVQASGNSNFVLNGNSGSTINNNAGSIQISGSTITLGINTANLNNSAIFTATNCTFNTQVGGSGGVFTNNSGGTFTTNSCGFTLSAQGASIANSGTFTANTTTFDLNSSQSPGANIINSNTGTFNVGVTGTACTITLENGGQNTVANADNFTWGTQTILYMTSANASVTNKSGTFTLMSDNTGSATVGPVTSGAVLNGVFNVQRYITGTNSNYSSYRLLSSPVNCTKAASATSSSTLNYISLYYLNKSATANGTTYNGIFTGGPGGTAGGFTVPTTNPILYFYNEALKTSNTAFTSGKNVGISAINSGGGTPVPTTVNMVSTAKPVNGASYTTPSNLPIPVGNGFIDYFVGPNTISNAAGPISSATITNIGFINQQNVTVYLWYTPNNGTAAGTSGQLSFTTPTSGAADTYQGFNMLGNPYPSTLNLAQIFTDNGSAIDNIYVLSDNTSSSTGYNVYTATGNSSPSPAYIVSGQGFLVHAKSGGQTFTFQEGEKAPTQQPTGSSLLLGIPKQTDQPLTGLYMKMVQDSATYHYCGIYFRSDWVSTFKTGDAKELDGASPKVYMSSYTSDGVQTAVNHQPDYTAGINVKLYANATTDGIYHLNIEGIRNIDTLYDIFLIDHYKNDSLDMRRYGSYAFNIYKSDTSSFGGSRFELSIHPRPLPAYALLNFAAQKASSAVQLTWKTENEANYTGFVLQKLNGTQYSQLNSQQSNSSGSYSFTDHNPVTGNNTYRLQQSGITGSITYSSPITIIYSPSTGNGSLSVYPNPAKELISINLSTTSSVTSSYKANIYNSSGKLMTQTSVTGASWTEDVTQYSPGTYIIQIKDNNGNLIGNSKFVKTN
ncbi:T9SS type A sorting domain-containing protein [Mucilaginibacter sp. X4EP1]|uniref:T9SS type A sorting domain-containing protein n=1 Tax=Mucilaginibacter sp. X4EP1 TaxID=2723092 RepID=UPI002167D397|nr:T9SS type A sorting domain-containing protein [Mucilaginibacter sp. X4EP1]MCS3813666.1 hypothetical protein [Mucilaginibacter sp. X4EP1]